MKIIFLDIDGVLATMCSIIEGGPESLDKECVKQFNRIMDETDARVIITSTWRLYYTPIQLKDKLHAQGLVTKRILGFTPEIYNQARGKEIQKWLDDHEERVKAIKEVRYGYLEPVEDFIIIDDGIDMAHLIEKLVQTNMEDGLTKYHANLVISLLNE